VWLSGWRESPAARILDEDQTLIMFRSMKRCMQALGAWIAWSEWLGKEQPLQTELSAAQAAAVSAVLDAAIAEQLSGGHFVLDEVRSREILSIIGVSSAPGGVATGEEEAERVAERIGYPVVVKAVVPGLAHKSDVGAVALNLKDGEAVHAACAEMRRSLADKGVTNEIRQFLVCRMEPAGFEAIVGGSRDPLFGPTVACGAGGTAVEQLKDVVLRLAPTNRAEVRSELENLKVWNAIAGGRGAKARDIDALVDAAVAVAGLMAVDRRIMEVDVNPLLVRFAGESIVALDALLTVANEE
jgi:acyl-CoA synthetase (NDP forming)